MATGSTKPPKPPDPEELYRLNNLTNRVNQQTPFGSTGWSEDAEGRATQTTSLSPQMQAALDRAFALSGQPMERAERFDLDPYLSQIGAGIAGRVGDRYGVSSPSKPQQQTPPPPVGNTLSTSRTPRG